MPGRTSFVASAKVIALWTLASRVTGLVRDILLNAHFGQTWVQDAFNYGFQVPNLFRRLFGEGALSAVFVPAFTETLEKQGPPAAWRLCGAMLARLLAALVALTVAINAVILLLWMLRPPEPMRLLILGLTAVMLPFMISICVVALLSSILNCLGRFGLPAAMPIVLNVFMIGGVAWLAPAISGPPQAQVYAVAWSVLAAGAVQLLVILPAVGARGAPLRLVWRCDEPALRGVFRSIGPVMIGQGVLLLNAFLDSQMCTLLTRGPDGHARFTLLGSAWDYPLEAGALSAVTNAQRLYQFPLGVLAISLATAALPAFSRLAARGDVPGLRTSLSRALRLALFEGLPCGVMLAVLAEPIVALLFQHGNFTAAHTARAAAVLRWYGLGVWAFCLQHVVLRGFYSFKDTLTPMWVGASLVAVNLGGSFLLLWLPAVREQAFGISTAATAAVNVGISLYFLRRRLGGRIGGRAIAGSAARVIASAAVAALVARALLGWLAGDGMPAAVSERCAAVFVPLAAAAAVYVGLAAALRMPEIRWVLGREAVGDAAA